jgi:hypothetical protein
MGHIGDGGSAESCPRAVQGGEYGELAPKLVRGFGVRYHHRLLRIGTDG